MPFVLLALALAAPPGTTLSAPERLAAAKAAGFQVRGGRILNECEEPTEPTFERRDLNGDGTPELIVTDEGMCYGGTGAMFAVLQRTGPSWRSVFSTLGIPTVLKTRHAGWADIEVGGPGLHKMPVARWNGTKYVL